MDRRPTCVAFFKEWLVPVTYDQPTGYLVFENYPALDHVQAEERLTAATQKEAITTSLLPNNHRPSLPLLTTFSHPDQQSSLQLNAILSATGNLTRREASTPRS